jgi:hypothetical protein
MPGEGTMQDAQQRGQSSESESTDSGDVYLKFGHEELVIHHRYETISIVNDVMMALWFLIGSIFFFYPSLTYAATWFFTVGSAQFLIRPMIRLARNLHLQRLPGTTWQM